MSKHWNATVAILATSLAMAPLVNAQAPKARPVRKIAVIAVRDSGLLTLCPVVGKDVIESNIRQSGVRVRVTVSYPAPGRQLLGFHSDDGFPAWITLPVATTQASQPTVTTPDVEGKAELEASIRARGYAVVDSTVAAAAPLQALVDQLDGKGRKHPAYLPVCAVNGGAPY